MSKKKRSFIASSFVIFISLFPAAGRKLWQKWYDFLASHDSAQNFRFMNYGYDSTIDLALSDEDEKNRYQIQLYEHVLDGIDLTNQSLAEVGCGRGGGLEYLSRTKNLSSIAGVDLSEKAISRCKQDYPDSGISFINASADDLPFDDSSIDIVLNVESSHCYPDMDKFLAEVYRVLKPGAQLAICDIRTKQGIDDIEKSFKESGFKLNKKHIITENVLSALEKMTDERIKIADTMPVILKKAFEDFAGIHSSAAYDMMKNDKLVYASYQLSK